MTTINKLDRVKKSVKSIKNHMDDLGIKAKMSEVYELKSRIDGFKNWGAYQAHLSPLTEERFQDFPSLVNQLSENFGLKFQQMEPNHFVASLARSESEYIAKFVENHEDTTLVNFRGDCYNWTWYCTQRDGSAISFSNENTVLEVVFNGSNGEDDAFEHAEALIDDLD